MALRLLYITNIPEVARIAEKNGVERIMVDMEYIGKSDRQGGMDTVQLHHSFDDIRNIKNSLTSSELIVRINPIHAQTGDYPSSKEEIDRTVDNGADIIMLPYFKTVDEVRFFIDAVGGRAKTLLLFETKESAELCDEIIRLDGIDEVHIGLNDMSLSYGMNFMFELLPCGTADRLCGKFRQKGIPYGFGGIAALGLGMVPAEMIIKEHYRLGSTGAILSRSFCNTDNFDSYDAIAKVFEDGLRDIRALEAECQKMLDSGNIDYFENNRRETYAAINKVAEILRKKKQQS